MMDAATYAERLRRFFSGRPDVLLAFLFGSAATGRRTEASDVDVGVYLRDGGEEDRLCRALTGCLETEVDLIRLDRAPATLVSAILKHGIPLAVRDRRLYLDLLIEATMEAEDFVDFAREFRAIAGRSASLAPEDEARLLERVQFLEDELRELEGFRALTLEQYRNDKTQRRNIERWAENIINAAIDVAKIVLASEHRPMPRTYQDAMESLALLAGLRAEEAQRFASFARLRNLLAHEYLEILYERIGQFVREYPPLYERIRQFLDEVLKVVPPSPEG